jgi:predicted MPP superfamily phosphohydrolase
MSSSRGDVRLLLTHSPELLDKAPVRDAGVALALAGHTHGGQVRLGSSAVPFVPQGSGRFVAGWYDLAGCRAYVSRGTGTSIVPARFTCRRNYRSSESGRVSDDPGATAEKHGRFPSDYTGVILRA